MMANVAVRVNTSMSAAASTPVYFAITGAAARSVTASRRPFTPAQKFSVQVVDRHPAGVDHVDEHQGVVAGEVDVNVVGRVVGAVPGQFHALAADLQAVPVGEGHVRDRPARVVVAQQQRPGLFVPDARYLLTTQDRMIPPSASSRLTPGAGLRGGWEPPRSPVRRSG